MSPTLEVVGRESEIDSVHDFLEAVPGGPVALLIEGEAGIGKTTLWREGIADAGERGLQVLTSRPVEAEIALPFAVLGDLLGDVPDAALGRLPDPQREALEVALLRAELERSLEGCSAERSRSASSVLFGCSPRTRRWSWRSTTRSGSIHRRPMPSHSRPGDCATNRSASSSRDARRRAKHLDVELETALDADRLTRLVIGPLDIRSLDRLLRAQLGRQFLRPALVELQRVSGGNPFFALELGRALLTRDVSPAPGEPLPVPATLNELVRERLAGIPTAAREAALVVSALSRPTVALVAAAAGGGGVGGRAREGGSRRSPGGRRRPRPVLTSAARLGRLRADTAGSETRTARPLGGDRRRSGRAGAPSRPRCERSRCPGGRDRRGCCPTCTSTWRSAGRSGALGPGTNAHAAR